MKKVKKIRICTFDINRYGGIIANIESKIKAFKELGYDVDILMLTYTTSDSVNSFNSKITKLQSGEFQDNQDVKSQNGGYEKSEVTGYWRNSYYGWLLPPITNRISVFNENALDQWWEAVKDVDLLIWSFMPTKCKEAEGFNFWYKFFDLPSRIKQIFSVHDAYFDVRNSWITCLKEKILYLDCAHIAGYNCSANIGIPRDLNFIPRYIPKKMPYKSMKEKEVDFFSAHIFKSMKRMDDLLRMMPYLNEGKEKHSLWMGGSGIELYYMMAKEKIKESYLCKVKNDPDLPIEYDKNRIPLWTRAEEAGLNYVGLVSNSDVYTIQENSKFCIDPSYCKHYAQYSITHINGFTIECMINGSYPIYRDYRGLDKKVKEYNDPLFDSIKAVVIPWDVTPKQFAGYLKQALKMKESKYRDDIEFNFELCKEFFDPKKNMKNIINLVENGVKNLEVGKDSDVVITQSEKIMKNFFGIDLPIKWTR